MEVRSLRDYSQKIDILAKKLAREWILNDAVLLLELDELDAISSDDKFIIFNFIKSLECPLIVTTRDRLDLGNIYTITYEVVEKLLRT